MKTIVRTDEDDEIVFAKRFDRVEEDVYSRFVKDRERELTNIVLVFLKRDEKDFNIYHLFIMIPAEDCEKSPQSIKIDSTEEFVDSLNYWSNHATVFGIHPIDENSIIDYCPYMHLYEDVFDYADALNYRVDSIKEKTYEW